jgi:thymidylate synthase
MRRYDTFHQAFFYTLEDIYHNYQFLNSPRGFKSREILSYHFAITNPRERICFIPSRKTNIIFNFAEVLWYLSGDNSLDYIGYYAKNIKNYSVDGRTLTGTAYGPKIFDFGRSKLNQWDRIIDILTEDAASKRAYIQIFDADESLALRNIDVSCTLGLQFFIRENKLYVASFMRANDAFRGMVSDIFSFTFIQELMALQLGLSLGDYFHNVGSIHLYEQDDNATKKIIQEVQSQPGRMTNTFLFPAMPPGDNWDFIKIVLEYEKQLRTKKIVLNLNQLEREGLPDYWQQVIMLFGLYQGIVYDNSIDNSIYERLYDLYQYLVANKWSAQSLNLSCESN